MGPNLVKNVFRHHQFRSHARDDIAVFIGRVNPIGVARMNVAAGRIEIGSDLDNPGCLLHVAHPIVQVAVGVKL